MGYMLEHMGISLCWRIIYICPWSFFLCVFLFCYFLLQDDLIESSSDEEESGLQDEKKSVFDMEDLGNIMNRAKKAKVRLW